MAMWIEHTSSIETTVMRVVICEECDCEFVYEMAIHATGQSNSSIFYDGSAPDKARKQAKESFREQMKYNCRAVPCPECAHYQQHMLKQAKWDKAGRLILGGLLAGGLLVVLGLVLLKSSQMRLFGLPVLAVGVLVGGGLCGVGAVIYSSHDPNDLPEAERFRRVEDNTIARAEYESLFREQAAADYAKLCKRLDQGKEAKLRVAGQFFADPDQVYEERRLKAELPNGEPVRVPLTRKMKSGETFTYKHERNGRTIRFEYTLLVYTETREKK